MLDRSSGDHLVSLNGPGRFASAQSQAFHP